MTSEMEMRQMKMETKIPQNLQDATKAFLRGKLIPVQSFLKKQGQSQ